MTESSNNPLYGLWQPRPLQNLYYGPSAVEKNLRSLLPSSTSKAFIITGTSLASKTPLVSNVESLLGPSHHAGTFSKISQHAPVAQLDEATDLVASDTTIDTIISLGGGSPIDSAKAISHRLAEKTGSHLHHICIPTTLSAAECTHFAGYTTAEGVKTAVAGPELAVDAILYDPAYGAHTPLRLWLSTGMRAMDHSMETMYHPTTAEMPAKIMALNAASQLFELLPASKRTHPNDPEVITRCFLAAYMSLGFIGRNLKGGLGLSHAMGYALGSPYGIPHGETSCLTLGHVVKMKARDSNDNAQQIARMLAMPGLGGKPSGDAERDALEVGDRVLALVHELGLAKTLTEHGVGKDQLDLIAKRATGAEEGKLFENVKGMVRELW